MQIGFIGLGKMGKHMVLKLLQNKQQVVAWNRSPEPLKEVKRKGAQAAKNIRDLVNRLKGPKIIWLMLPAGKVTDMMIDEVTPLLGKGDILIDGGNSNFHDTLRRHKYIAKINKGVHFMDVGVSGGLAAATTGYAMMVGAKSKLLYKQITPLLNAMCVKNGHGYMGPPGSGHYVKMVHNAIEYGQMQAIAEGFNLLHKGRFPKTDLKEVSKVWNNGCIVSGFLMEMAGNALQKNSSLSKTFPIVDDNGEGKWAITEAMEYEVPFSVNSEALAARYQSREKNSFAHRMLAEIRNQFGGHAVKRKK